MSDKILIVIDPGHYTRYNKGAISGYYEGDKMYTLSLYEKELLETYNDVDVILTHELTKDLAVYERGQIAVKKGVGYKYVLFMSNHTNAYDKKACGVVAFRSRHLPKSEILGRKLVEAVVDVMAPETGITYSRGVLTRNWDDKDYYGVIRGSVSSATSQAEAKKGPVNHSYIIEHGFHDNPIECAFLMKPENLKKIAEAKVNVIVEYFGLTKKVVETLKVETPIKEIYRVRKSWDDVKSQIGAFYNLDNAKEKADDNQGYNVYNSAGELIYPIIKKTVDELAREVISGKWGVGTARKEALTKAGYDYSAVQKRVNEILS